ncbi:sulfurtransferase TusA family protein [Planctomycetota bacterium]|nr:sulfurtransferase TusA family protein [Planctomycetota bacterium]
MPDNPDNIDVPEPAREWDAGEMGCGELVMHLRMKMKEMQAGQVMLLTALDLGAPEDMPAWCRMTGHTLLKFEHPKYWIQRKDN